MSRTDGYATKKRSYILKYFEENVNRDVCVADIELFLRENNEQTNVTTIYRYLEKLVDQGIVLKTLHGKKEQATFQYIAGKKECHNHLHLKCQECGRIIHLDCGFMSTFKEHVVNGHGFYLDCSNSYLAGVCNQCKNGVSKVKYNGEMKKDN